MARDKKYLEKHPDDGNCFSNATKKCCAYFIYIVSTISFIMGLALCVYGYLSFTGGSVHPPEEYNLSFDMTTYEYMGVFCLAFGLVALCVGILGCLAAYCKNPCTSLPFCAVSFILSLITIAIGVLVVGLDWDDIREQACDFPQDTFDGFSGTQYMKQQYGELVDDVMCSDACVCKDDESNRLRQTLDRIPQLSDYGFIGREVSDGGDEDLINIATSEEGEIESYVDCYNSVISESPDSDNEMYDEFVNLGGFDFLEKLEEEFECAGICYMPLFYLTKGPQNAPVAKECVGAFLDSVKSTEGAGAVAIITGITLFAASLGSIPLCSDFTTSLD